MATNYLYHLKIYFGEFYIKKKGFGKDDSYCKVIANNEEKKTKIKYNTQQGDFNQNISFIFNKPVKKIKFEMYDHDKLSVDDLIGSYDYNINWNKG